MGMFDIFNSKKRIEKQIANIREDVENRYLERVQKKYGRALAGAGNNYLYSGNGSKWPYGTSANAPGVSYDHASLRQQARNKMQDSVAARSVVSRFGENVADTGLTLDLMPKHEILGITAERAAAWAADVESRFNLWAKSKKSHRREIFTFFQSHRFLVDSQQRDGEYFVRLFYDVNDKSLTNPLQFDFIDPQQIRGDAITTSYGPLTGDAGIELDAKGAEKRFKVWVIENNKYVYKEIPRVGPVSGRVYMLHGFSPEYAGQTRGFSRLSHAIQELENLTDFSSAHIKKAIAQSMIGGAVIPSKEKPGSNPFEALTSQAGPLGKESQTLGAANAVEDTGERFEFVPEADFRTASNIWLTNLDAGEDIKPIQNTAPVNNYNDFVNSIITHLSASMGQPVEATLMKFNNNYSSTRGTLLLFWRVAEIWRQELASDFLSPVFEMWLSGEIAAGRVSAPGWSDPVLRQAWLNSRWYGPPMPNIDPQRTANANKTMAELGAETLSSIARGHNGSKFEDNASKLKKEYENLPTPPWEKKEEMTQVEEEEE